MISYRIFFEVYLFSDRSFQMLFLGSKSGPEKSCQMDPLDPGQRRRRLWKKCLRLLWFENGKEWSSKKVGLRKRRETLGMCKKQVDYNSTTLKKTHIRRNQVYPGIMMFFFWGKPGFLMVFGGNLGNLGSILTGKHHRTMVPLCILGRFDWV